MSAEDTYVSPKLNDSQAVKKHRRGWNFDKTVQERDDRIFRICQGLILKKFQDADVTLDEKYRLAEKIYLVRAKPGKEDGNAPIGETKVIIIRDSNGSTQANKSESGSIPRPLSILRV